MKIRTITAGITLSHPIDESEIMETAAFLQGARERYEKAGIEVQTVRITTQPWEEYLGHLCPLEIVGEIQAMEKLALDSGVDFLSIGTVLSSENIPVIPDIIRTTSRISASTTIAHREHEGGINHEAARKTAAAIRRISEETEQGSGNFNFAATANCQPDIPFFPASYHRGKPCFGLGLECSDLVYKAFESAGSLVRAEDELKLMLETSLKPLETIGEDIAKREGIRFNGIDVSTAPSLEKDESLAFAFEKLGLGRFGEPGTLTITGMITRVLKNLELKTCGYSGVMLPIMEDVGLAQRCSEGLFDIDNILLYSAVCGTGLDCIPLPGDISEDKLYAILCDMATLALSLNKPLSARLFPVPGKTSGERTDFRSPYLVDCDVMKVK